MTVKELIGALNQICEDFELPTDKVSVQIDIDTGAGIIDDLIPSKFFDIERVDRDEDKYDAAYICIKI